MTTTELTEALARLEQDGETAVAGAARKELDDMTARIAELEKKLENIKKHGEAMLFIFDRDLPEVSIKRDACDNFKNALKG